MAPPQSSSPTIDPGASHDAQSSLRETGRFFWKALLLAGGIGGALVTVGGLSFVLTYLLEVADRVRAMLGAPPAPGQPDALHLSIVAAFLLVPLVFLVVAWSRYRSLWKRRIRQVWEDRRDLRHLSKIPEADPASSETFRQRQNDYLAALRATELWRAEIPAEDDPRQAASKILAALEKRISERALATGFVVGLSRSRWIDQLTIVFASLELQLFVLARLGKKPSLWSWYELLTRAGSSLFVNTYLNREQAIEISYTMKAVATGLDALAGAIEDLEFDEAFDAVEDLLHRFATGDVSGVVVNAFVTGLEFGTEGAMSLGSAGLQLMSQLIEKGGDELFQGTLSAGIVYYHGLSLAARCLALDEAHRSSPEMTRTPFECMRAMAVFAGQMVLDHVRKRRKLLREKRRKAYSQVPGVRPVVESFTRSGAVYKKLSSIPNLFRKKPRGDGGSVA